MFKEPFLSLLPLRRNQSLSTVRRIFVLTIVSFVQLNEYTATANSRNVSVRINFFIKNNVELSAKLNTSDNILLNITKQNASQPVSFLIFVYLACNKGLFLCFILTLRKSK